MGLGIQMKWNRPGCPQQNGVVERFNGLLDQWGDPERCANWEQWTQQVQLVVTTQRELYPAVGEVSRMAAHPELLNNPRQYGAEQEANWQIEPVRKHLAEGGWVRQVNKKGQISLYHRAFSVGCRSAGKQVWVRLDAEANEWIVRDERGQTLREIPAAELTAERIQKLDVSYVKPHERRRREQRPNPVAHYAT